jgi:uncharacterized protein YkwD
MQGMPRSFAIRLCIGFCLLSALPAGASASSFMDMEDGHANIDAVLYLQETGVINGFADGTFRPDRRVTRAEAVKIIISVLPDEIDDKCTLDETFTDVTASDWVAPYLCNALKQGIIVPEETNTFRPTDRINMAELSSILARAYELPMTEASEPWFASAVRALGGKNAIPSDIRASGEQVTRGQLAEMVWRLAVNVTDRDAADAESVISAQCQWSEAEDLPGVDDEEIVRTWLAWVNAERKAMGLYPYKYSKQLSRTADLWSRKARDEGGISHKRAGQSAYYDYKIMTGWFANLDLTFSNKSGSTFTENIGWGVYRCAEADCTQRFTNAVRTTFDFFMSEKGKVYRPHYNSMVNANFTHAGLGIALAPGSGRYYLTVHYGTDITSEPDPVCP